MKTNAIAMGTVGNTDNVHWNYTQSDVTMMYAHTESVSGPIYCIVMMVCHDRDIC